LVSISNASPTLQALLQPPYNTAPMNTPSFIVLQ